MRSKGSHFTKSQLSDSLLNEMIKCFSKVFANSIDLITNLIMESISLGTESGQENFNVFSKS